MTSFKAFVRVPAGSRRPYASCGIYDYQEDQRPASRQRSGSVSWKITASGLNHANPCTLPRTRTTPQAAKVGMDSSSHLARETEDMAEPLISAVLLLALLIAGAQSLRGVGIRRAVKDAFSRPRQQRDSQEHPQHRQRHRRNAVGNAPGIDAFGRRRRRG